MESEWNYRSRMELGLKEVALTSHHSVELGRCGGARQAPLVTGTSNVYECDLSLGERVTVQPGDGIGMELSFTRRALFRLYFNTSGPANYVFNRHDYTFSLSDASSVRQDQPQIFLTVVPDVPITPIPILPTTQPLTATEATSTDPPTTHATTSIEVSTASTSAITCAEPHTTTTDEALATNHTTAQITHIDTTSTQTTLNSTVDFPATTYDSVAATGSPAKPNSSVGMTEFPSRSSQQSDYGVIVGSVVGGVVVTILLSAVIILTIAALVCQSRKYKGERVTKNDGEMNITMTNNVQTNAQDIDTEVKANLSYVPVFRQIATENNVAYGEAVNLDSNHYYGLYESIDPPFEDSTLQPPHKEESGQSYDNLY